MKSTSIRALAMLTGSVLSLVGCNNGEVSGIINSHQTWGTVQPIEANDGSAYQPQIAFDAHGDAIAVWHQFDGVFYSIYSNRYVAGIGWGVPQLIETSDHDAYSPKLAVDPDGNAVVVWGQSTDENSAYSVFANHYVVGSGWATAQSIETSDSGAAAPQVAIDASGNAIAVWVQDGDGSYNNIYTNRFTVGFGWSTSQAIKTIPELAYNPKIASNQEGDAIAVWVQDDGAGQHNIYANHYVPGAGWATAQAIETNSEYAVDPQVAFDFDGNAIAVWEQSDGTRLSIQANRFTKANGWSTPQNIDSNDGYSHAPQLAFDASGNAMAIWEHSDSVGTHIQASRYVSGVGWRTPQLLENNAGIAQSPKVALDMNGNAEAVWYQFDGTTNSIYANRYTAGIGWGDAGLIETDNGSAYSLHDAYDPQVAFDSNGNALAVWSQGDGTYASIYSNRLQ